MALLPDLFMIHPLSTLLLCASHRAAMAAVALNLRLVCKKLSVILCKHAWGTDETCQVSNNLIDITLNSGCITIYNMSS